MFPKNLSDLKNYPRIVKTTMERELLWTAFLINNNVNKINEYLLFKKEYESYVFIGEYHEALKILNLVKEYFNLTPKYNNIILGTEKLTAMSTNERKNILREMSTVDYSYGIYLYNTLKQYKTNFILIILHSNV